MPSHTITLAGVVAESMDAAEVRAFWEEARRTMSTAEARAWQTAEVERYASSLKDWLEPEGWSDIL